MMQHVPEEGLDNALATKKKQRKVKNALSERIRHELASIACPELAPGMQRYMKSSMPYVGVTMPAIKRMCKSLFSELSYTNSDIWQKDVLGIWRNAVYREERYVATELSSAKLAASFQRVDALPLFEEMIVTGAWWDHIDIIAANQLWTLLCNDRDQMRIEMIKWAQGDNLWKRRSSIICQLKAKTDTDLDLLYACMEPSLSSSDFFLRKAIGWALRQYARTNPDEVRRYVASNRSRLSALSQREALKYLIPSKPQLSSPTPLPPGARSIFCPESPEF